ncbi:MAG: acylneuraminate cytidylyltransferase family protein [Bacteroidota bacterium]
MKILAVITARGGSKGVKDKNIRLVDGQSLISYAIECANESKYVTDCVTTTDSERIADVVKKWNGEVLMRPPKLARDDTPSSPVVMHVIDELEKEGRVYDIIVLLQPTAPIRTGEDVDRVIQMLKDDPKLDSVISVVPMQDVHPAKMYHVDNEQNMQTLVKDGERLRRQDLTPVYLRNGCIYAIRTAAFREQKELIINNKKAYVMSEDWLANVDSERDLMMTELLVKAWKKERAARGA